MSEDRANTIVLVDFQSIARPIYEANANTDVTRTAHEIVSRIRALASGYPHVGLCCDSGRSWRKEIEPTYKANRRETPADYLHQLHEAVATLKQDGFPVFEQEGFEADDLIGCAIEAYVDQGDPFPMKPARQLIVISYDKDLLQLVSDDRHVIVRRPAMGKYPEIDYTEAAVIDKLGVGPSQVVDLMALVGDTADNVRGADRIGDKTAMALLSAFGSLDAILAADDSKFSKPSVLASLKEFAPRADHVRQLVKIRTEGCTVDFSPLLQPRRPLDVAEFDGTEDIEATFGPFNGHAIVPPIYDAPKPDPAPSVAEKEGVKAEPAPVQPPPKRPTVSLVEPGDSTALVKADRLGALEELQPHSLQTAHELSKAMHQARLFSAYGSPEAILSTIIAGREIGLPAMAALRAFHIIEGKPTLAAGAIHSMVLRSGQAEYFHCTERTPTRATFATKRKGAPKEIELSYSVEEAKQAWTKDLSKFLLSGWGKNPADMCVARACTKLARLVYPDVLEGHYAKEEFDE